MNDRQRTIDKIKYQMGYRLTPISISFFGEDITAKIWTKNGALIDNNFKSNITFKPEKIYFGKIENEH